MKKVIFIFLLLIISITFYMETANEEVEQNLKDSYSAYQKEESHIIGKIKIQNSTIDTYIVQSNDNEYFLNHNYLKEEDKLGSIFLDYRNKITDNKLLIYGHNSKEGDAPLKELSNYLNEEYFENHKEIYLTINEKTYTYQIFSIMIVEEGNNLHTRVDFTNTSYKDHLNYLEEKSLIKTNIKPKEDDYILSIQTCNYEPENSYLLISAKRN